MSEIISKGFFPNSTIEGFSFCFYCPNMCPKDKLTIINCIQKSKGVSFDNSFYYFLIGSNKTFSQKMYYYSRR